MKVCTKCGIEKPIDDFYSNQRKKDGHHTICKMCHTEDVRKRYHKKYKHDPEYKKRRDQYSHDWHLKNKEKNNARVAKDRRDKRMKCIEHYGGKCACCGESHYEFLAIDHINGGGRVHRASLGTKSFHRWLIKNNFPEGFRVLCHNCNQSFGLYGYCPHENLTPEEIKKRKGNATILRGMSKEEILENVAF
ncbi:MAG: hypothetical protein JRE23_02835 [Deltaproteobacteria bacterium]|nr:hypothetical protein [Deltaproteobacteria bacterium]